VAIDPHLARRKAGEIITILRSIVGDRRRNPSIWKELFPCGRVPPPDPTAPLTSAHAVPGKTTWRSQHQDSGRAGINIAAPKGGVVKTIYEQALHIYLFCCSGRINVKPMPSYPFIQ